VAAREVGHVLSFALRIVRVRVGLPLSRALRLAIVAGVARYQHRFCRRRASGAEWLALGASICATGRVALAQALLCDILFLRRWCG